MATSTRLHSTLRVLSERATALTSRQRLAVSVGPAVLFVLLALLVRWALGALDSSSELVERTHRIRVSAEQAYSRVKDSESALRGFLITGDERHLDPALGARADVERDFRAVRALVLDSASREMFGAVEQLAARRLDLVERNIARSRRGELDPAAVRSVVGEGKLVMDSLRQALAITIARQEALLARRIANDRRLSARVDAALLVASLLAVLLALAGNLLLREFAEGKAADAQRLEEQNQELQRQALEVELQSAQLHEQQIELEMQQSLLEDQAGELAAANEELTATNQELTARREEAESAQRQTSLILETAVEGIIGIDTEGKVTFANPASERLLGWPTGELLGRILHDTIHHHHADGTPYPAEECPLSDALRTGGEFHSEAEVFWRLDGMPLPIEYRVAPILRNGIEGAVVSFTDIGQRREALAALAASEERFRAVQVGSPDGFMLFRSLRAGAGATGEGSIIDFEWTYLNPAARGIPGLPDGELVGRRLLEEMPRSRSESLFNAWVRVVETGEPWQHELTNREAGVVTAFRLIGVKVGDGVGVTFSDITSRVMAEEALAAREAERDLLLVAERAARAEAEEANRAKSQFLAVMSHELRTPLNAIGGYAQLLEIGLRGPVSETQQEDLRRIRRSGQHLLSLINDVLNYAKLEAGRVELNPATIRMSDVLAGIEPLVTPPLLAKGISYTIECPGECLIVADPEKLQQILVNLLINAGKFTAEGGAVTVTCELVPEQLRILVRDTGRGISPEKLRRVFEPFVQVDRHLTTASQQGVGLGLAISRDLARAMGGELAVQSEVGVGSTFELRLPQGAPAPTIDAGDAAPGGQAAGLPPGLPSGTPEMPLPLS